MHKLERISDKTVTCDLEFITKGDCIYLLIYFLSLVKHLALGIQPSC